MSVNTYIDEDLPSEARKLTEQFEEEFQKIHQKTEKKIAKTLKKADKRVNKLKAKAKEKIKLEYEKAILELKPLQSSYIKEGKLDEALAIRAKIREISLKGFDVQPDPGNLSNFQEQIGQTLLFEITGDTSGSVWGTDIYTTDSYLATAAVHAGVVRAGEKRIVKVTILGQQDSFTESTRNSVTSYSYGSYTSAYQFN